MFPIFTRLKGKNLSSKRNILYSVFYDSLYRSSYDKYIIRAFCEPAVANVPQFLLHARGFPIRLPVAGQCGFAEHSLSAIIASVRSRVISRFYFVE